MVGEGHREVYWDKDTDCDRAERREREIRKLLKINLRLKIYKLFNKKLENNKDRISN